MLSSGTPIPTEPYDFLGPLKPDTEKYFATHNQDCKRLFIYDGNALNVGFGSQINNMLVSVATAFIQNRALVMDEGWMREGYRCNENTTESAYLSCFKYSMIGPPTCNVTELRALARSSSGFPVWSCGLTDQEEVCKHSNRAPIIRSNPNVFDSVKYHQTNTRMGQTFALGDHNYTYFDVVAYAAKEMWKVRDEVKEEVDEAIEKLQLEGAVCGFHIRRGDKVTEVEELAAIEDYLAQAKLYGQHCDTCFIASDDLPHVLDELQSKIGQYLPNCKIQYVNSTSLTSQGFDQDTYNAR